MKQFSLLVLLSLLFVKPAFSALEESLSVPPGCELIGLIPFASHSVAITGDAKRRIDALVPILLQRGKEKLVRIEGHCAKGATRAEYITKSMYLAKEVQKYLMYRHNVQLDLYLGAMDDTIVPGDGQFVRIVLYPNNYDVESIDLGRELVEKYKDYSDFSRELANKYRKYKKTM